MVELLFLEQQAALLFHGQRIDHPSFPSVVVSSSKRKKTARPITALCSRFAQGSK